MRKLIKTKKIALICLLTSVFLTASGCQKRINADFDQSFHLGGKILSVNVADSESKRQQGLSGREKLEDDEGMLFKFETQNVKPAFWMKDMNFSIDIIWIDDSKVIGFTKNVPAPKAGTQDKDLPSYSAPSAVDEVLEVNAGFVDKYQIKVGDEAKLVN